MEVAIISAAAVIITAILTHWLTRKSQIKFEERKLKETYYTQYHCCPIKI
jgi:protein-S-isoprenylcysteine O-methyltransferase Ste14